MEISGVVCCTKNFNLVLGERGGREITVLLRQMNLGDAGARDVLAGLVYGELRRLAHNYLARERSGHSLQATALVHEVWLRLSADDEKPWESRRHFFGVAAQTMRNLLVDHARKKAAEKRGGARRQVELEDVMLVSNHNPELVLAVDRALARLSVLDERQGRIVEMRCFAGFSIDEISDALGVSSRTVKRDWQMARAWLRRELTA